MAIFMRKSADAKAEAFITNAGQAQSPDRPERVEEPSKTVVNVRIDTALLDRIDTDARRLGINRTAWLHFAANKMLIIGHEAGRPIIIGGMLRRPRCVSQAFRGF
jgi:hypothetical protein